MSLKAKLEAVIYAAEEPVTLAQMAVLFAEEALAWKAQHLVQLANTSAAESDSGEPTDTNPGDAPAAVELFESGSETGAELSGLLVTPEDVPVPETPALDAAETVEPPSAADADLEAKRAARQRDREVREILRSLLAELAQEYAGEDRGIEIREIAGGYRMATKPECHDAVRAFIKSLKPALKLSLPALETLAVIAYKQPVTAPEVGEIRGVDSAGVLGSLMSRKLIATAGRKQVVGRPMLYKTTKEFLLRFGLKDLTELPSMEEFEKMAAVELSENEELDFAGQTEANASDPNEEATTHAEESAETPAIEAPVERQDEVEIEAEV
jgi:segregation and condensation protein B